MRLKKHYSSREVAALTGLSARQLQWWDARRLFVPAIRSQRTEAGGFTERRYTPIDVLELQVLADLRRRRFSIPQLRRLLSTLRDVFGIRLYEAIGEGGPMHKVRSSDVRFTLNRDRSMIHYALAKKRLLAGLGPLGLRQVEFVVAEEGATAVAYALLHENANGWTIEEAGDRDPVCARLGAMLQVLIAREPSAPLPLIRAWWPSAFPVPPQLTLTDRSAARDVFMVRPLADVAMPEKAEDVFYWHSDYF